MSESMYETTRSQLREHVCVMWSFSQNIGPYLL